MFYIVFVALATPVGVTIGLVVTEHVDATSGVQTLVIGILNVCTVQTRCLDWVLCKALIGSVRVGSSHEEPFPDPNPT